MKIIIGLGNPGNQFKNTRHNVGFEAIDFFASSHSFPEFKLQKKSNSLISESDGIILAKPQTFMNESGKAVKKLTTKESDVIVLHDDIDLPVGKIKIVKDRGSAGHKGVESVIQNIGNEGLIRIRIGIAGKKETEAKKIVLKKFTEAEQKEIDGAIKKTTEALDLFIEEGLEKTMNKYN